MLFNVPLVHQRKTLVVLVVVIAGGFVVVLIGAFSAEADGEKNGEEDETATDAQVDGPSAASAKVEGIIPAAARRGIDGNFAILRDITVGGGSPCLSGCVLILQKIMGMNEAAVFIPPVDTNRYPTYASMIKRPMWLEKVNIT